MTNSETNFMTLYWLLTEVFILLDDIDRQTLREYNLSVPQFNALYHLNEKDGLSINDLTSRLICDKSNTTRLVDRLKQLGLVTRKRDTVDRRYVSVRLTEEGANLREGAITAHQDSVKNRIEILSTEEQQLLNKLLVRLRNGLHQQINQD